MAMGRHPEMNVGSARILNPKAALNESVATGLFVSSSGIGKHE